MKTVMIDNSTPEEIINVVKAFQNGETIQSKNSTFEDGWRDIKNPSWNFNSYDYRTKPIEKRTMIFTIFNDSGIEVFINDQWVAEVFVRGRYSSREAEQWVEHANQIAKAFPKASWQTIRDVVNQNIVFDYN